MSIFNVEIFLGDLNVNLNEAELNTVIACLLTITMKNSTMPLRKSLTSSLL